MPYISKEDRLRVVSAGAETAGELNYLITILMIANWQNRGEKLGIFFNDFQFALRAAIDTYWEERPASYRRINDILGAVAGALMEFARRVRIDTAEDGVWFKRFEKAISKVVHEFYNECAAPYEDGKIKENEDVYPT